MANFDFGSFDDLFGGEYDMFGSSKKEDKKEKKEKKSDKKKEEAVKTVESEETVEDADEEVDADLTDNEETIEEGDDGEEAVKAETKAKPAAKKSTGKKKDVGDTKLACPVEVYLPAHKLTLDVAGGTFAPTLRDVVAELKERYPETQLLVPVVKGNAVYFVLKETDILKANQLYDVTESMVKLAWGEKQGEYNADVFGGKPTVELSEVADFIASTDEAYEDIDYLGKENIIVPYFRECRLSVDKLSEEGYTLVVFGEEYPIADETGEVKNLTELAGWKTSQTLTAKQEFVFRISKASKKVYTFVKCPDAEVIGGVSGSVANKDKKKVTKSYALPLDVWLYTFGDTVTLTEDMFDGKKYVTLDQVRKHFAKSIDAFADTSRNVDAIYNKETNKLSLGFVSGKKG